MTLLIGAWYNEPGYKFNFSHKVDLFIREQVTSVIFSKYHLFDRDKTWYLNLVVATDSKTEELEVKGPEVRKRAKMIDYGLWLPYMKITTSAYPLKSYINYFLKALKIVFINYGVSKDDFDEIEEACMSEILNNPIYENA